MNRTSLFSRRGVPIILIITCLWARPSALVAQAAEDDERTLPGERDESAEEQSADSRQPFRIGYLPEGSDLSPARPLLEGLREALTANEALMKAFDEAGYGQISLRACDDPPDLIQRLVAKEFELAFVTSVAYSRYFTGEGSGYDPIFQIQLRSDRANPVEEEIYRLGVVFVGRASPLFGSDPTDDQIRAELESKAVAVSDNNSAASYIYPLLKMNGRFGLDTFEPLYCGTSEEAVKHVIAGLAEIGACEAHVLERLGEIDSPDGPVRLYQTLFSTDRMPSDPILLRSDLVPGNVSGLVGIELKIAIQEYFNASTKTPNLRVRRTSPRAYERMALALERLAEIGQGSDAARTGARNAPRAAPVNSSATPTPSRNRAKPGRARTPLRATPEPGPILPALPPETASSNPPGGQAP